MKTAILAGIAVILMRGTAAYAQPHDDHHNAPARPMGHAPAPAMARPDAHGPAMHGPGMQGLGMAGPRMAGPRMANPRMAGPGGASRHHLPPGIAAPRGHDRAPMWHGRSWAVGDSFVFTGFAGPAIRDVSGYGLPPQRPGTHWIYVDGWFLMVGNRTGKIFAEMPADY